jgi:hypothetical protein
MAFNMLLAVQTSFRVPESGVVSKWREMQRKKREIRNPKKASLLQTRSRQSRNFLLFFPIDILVI